LPCQRYHFSELTVLIGDEGGEGGQPLLAAREQIAGRQRVSQFWQTGHIAARQEGVAALLKIEALCSHPDGQPVGWIQAYPRGEGEVGTHAHEPPAPVRILQIKVILVHPSLYSRGGLGLSLSPIASRMRAGAPVLSGWPPLGWVGHPGSKALPTGCAGSRPRHLLEAPESEHPLGGAVLHPVLKRIGDFPQGPPGDPFSLPVGVKKTEHPLGLLEGLDQAMEQDAVEASIARIGCSPCDVRKRRSWEPPPVC